jgi:hypothetical protein
MAFSNWSSIRQKVAVVNKQSQGNQPGSPGQPWQRPARVATSRHSVPPPGRQRGLQEDPGLLELPRVRVPTKEPTVCHMTQLRQILARL